jgi:two-component system sensor histidine kinase VanS
VARSPDLSVRLKFTLSYVGFLMVAGSLLLAAKRLLLLRDLPDKAISPRGLMPIRPLVLHDYAPAAAGVVAFVLMLGLLGGWILAGRMLMPLSHITDATRKAAN